MNKLVLLASIFALASADVIDVGTYKDQLIRDHSMELFGVAGGTDGPGTAIPRTKGQKPNTRQKLAKGLKASFVSRSVAQNGDQIAFWPNDIDYTHLIVCIENSRAGKSPKGNAGINPGVQRVDVKTGAVETILYGTIRCDPVRTTQWGTILVGEESGADGGVYEILNPLTTTGHWIADRGTAGGVADIRDAIDSPTKSTLIVKRYNLPGSSWEAMHTLSNGVFYGGDELRPNLGLKGGAMYKFVPTTIYDCGAINVRPGLQCPKTITDLSQSPLASGNSYAIQALCSSGTEFGDGCQTGTAQWVKITSTSNPRGQANTIGATGYCRPEDMDIDQNFGVFSTPETSKGSKAEADTFLSIFKTPAGLKWCWTNTCGGGNFRSDVMCAYEAAADLAATKEVTANGNTYLSTDGSKAAKFLVTRFQQGDPRFNGQDNVEFQYKSGNLFMTEDPEDNFGEIWICLPDGRDRDLVTDGCIPIIGINDPIAEPTGIILDATGTKLYFHIQHGSQTPDLLDFKSNPVDGTTDDLMVVTGFKLPTGFSGPEADVGSNIENNLFLSRTRDLFGFDAPIKVTSGVEVARAAGQLASDRQTLAAGLHAEFVSRNVASNADQLAFWPNDIDYTHLFTCIEVGRSGKTPKGASGQNPGVQRIELATGKVETVVYGMSRCDGIRTTQWGTIVATEENGADGGFYEILNPLTTTGHWIADRGAAGAPADIRDAVDSTKSSSVIVKRTALPSVSYEGLQILHNGVVVLGDELRQTNGLLGGALYKFVPTTLYKCGAVVRPGQLCPNKINSLQESPFESGNIYALQAICDGNADYGQGCDYGITRWVKISSAADPRMVANKVKANGFCRPEDLALDSYFGIYGTGISSGADSEFFKANFNKTAGIRYCWANTCGDAYFGEVLCVIEAAEDIDAQAEVAIGGLTFLSTAGKTYNTFSLRRFQNGDPYMHDVDNVEFQPISNNLYIVEDYPYGLIYACLQDGYDRDLDSDGCLPMLQINSYDAEPTGFTFDGTGTTAFYHVQHGTQPTSLLNFATSPVDGTTDDLIKITGFSIPTGLCGWFAMVTKQRTPRNIGPLLNGNVLKSYEDGFSIKYTPCTRGRVGRVDFVLDGVTTSDSSSPYLADAPEVGNHTLIVQVYPRGKSTPVETKSIDFSIV